MLVWSQQHRIVSSLSYSFLKNKMTFLKTSESILERDKIFLSPSKFETYTESDFKFLVLWICFTKNTNKINTLKILQNLSKEDLQNIKKEKYKIINYKFTLEEDLSVLNTYMFKIDKYCNTSFNISLLQELFFKNKISVLCVYKYLKGEVKLNETPKTLTRIQKKFIERIDFFMSFFEKIKEDLNWK